MCLVLELNIAGGALCIGQLCSVAFVRGCVGAIHPDPTVALLGKRFKVGRCCCRDCRGCQ